MNIGFFGLLQIVLIVLKITERIDWSWLWIFTPVYLWLVTVIVLISLVSWLNKKDPLWRFRK